MSDVSKRIEELEAQRENREKGKYNLIPWYDHFPRLSEYVPGLFKGEMVKILAGTGVGKTKFSKYVSLFLPFELYKKYGIKFHTIYFALEESKDEFIDSLIIMMLYIKFKISIDRITLNSYFKDVVSKDILNKVREVEKYVEEILQHVDSVDNIHNATGMYKYVRNYTEKVGKHHYKEVQFYDEEKKRTYIQEVYSNYTPYDEDIFNLVVTDHVSLISPEAGLSQHQSMGRWSSDYCRKQITKNFNYTVINVQQVSMSSDDNEAYKLGRLEPSLSDLGNNKEVARDDMLVLALYNPWRYEIKVHNGYDISKYKDKYRSLSVLKNRYGRDSLKVGLYFDGAAGLFKELPKIINE